jgi:hypothetical protein
MVRKLKTSEMKSTGARVAEHRERLKEAGIKRLDISVSPQAFSSLQSWAKTQNLTYSEAAEHLFLAASAPVSFYSSTAQSQTTVLRNSPPENSSSVVAAFFNKQQTNEEK